MYMLENLYIPILNKIRGSSEKSELRNCNRKGKSEYNMQKNIILIFTFSAKIREG